MSLANVNIDDGGEEDHDDAGNRPGMMTADDISHAPSVCVCAG